jgi:GDSL-like Lipase/Acylhydrolase family
MKVVKQMGLNLPNQFRYDPDIGFTFVPNLQVRIPHESGGYLIRTNALGFRDHRTPAVDRRIRVFVFGDSFTAGDGVSNGKRYSDELERLFPEIEFYNFGLPGTGTDQHLIAFKKFAMSLRCDLVIVAVLVENIRRITAQFRPAELPDGRILLQPKPYFELHNGQLVRFHDPVPERTIAADELARGDAIARVDCGGRYPALRKLIKTLGIKDVVQRLTAYQPVPDFDSPASPAWLLMKALLLAWREASRSPLLIVPLPLYQHVEQSADPSAYQQRFREFAAETGLAVHDVLPDLQRYSPKERRQFRFATDVHLTPLGHHAVAHSLAPAVKSLLQRTNEERPST